MQPRGTSINLTSPAHRSGNVAGHTDWQAFAKQLAMRSRREERGEGRPETIDFLEFTHRCDKTRRHGWFTIRRESIAKRMRASLAKVKKLLRRRRHWDIGSIGRWLSRVIYGWYGHHAIPGNMIRLQQFRDEIVKAWLAELRRRPQRHR